MKSVEIKIKLHSATIKTFLWYGNSDPYDADEVFDDATQNESLYSGSLSLWPNKPFNLEFLDPLNPSWYLHADLSEFQEQPLKDLLASKKLVDQIIKIEHEEIEYELEDYDWDGFEGDFYYHLTSEISVFLATPHNSEIQKEIEDFIYQNLCFIHDITNSRYEHKSDNGKLLELEEKSKFLIVPISSFDLEDGTTSSKVIESSSDPDKSNLIGLIDYSSIRP